MTVSKRVLAAMSGGVDSSAAALLLQKDGYDVSGMTMRSKASLTQKAFATGLAFLFTSVITARNLRMK